MSRKSKAKNQQLHDYLVRLGVESPRPINSFENMWFPPQGLNRRIIPPIPTPNRRLPRLHDPAVWDTAIDNAAEAMAREIDGEVLRNVVTQAATW